jgi:flavodoxin I
MIGLFFGSTNGNTAAVAGLIRREFSEQAGVEVELFDIADYYLEEMQEFDYLIVGISTWDIGQLQRDWNTSIEEFDELDLQNKQAAVFGLGDQIGYPDTFGDAVFFVADKLEGQGAKLVGSWPIEGYSFTGSWALQAERFIGLMIDEDNQSDLTPERVNKWVRQLVDEFGLAPSDKKP